MELASGTTRGTAATLIKLLDADSRIMVQYSDGTQAAIVAVGEWHTDTGLGDGHWTVLVPSAISASQR